MTTLDLLLAEGVRRGASDIHLMVGQPPAFRVNGRIDLSPSPALTRKELSGLLDAVLNDAQRSEYRSTRRLCFSYAPEGLGFFRINLYSQLGRTEAAVRIGRTTVPTLQELGVPETVLECVRRPHGLFLVTGPTGVGKTTTLNAIIGRINAEERKKIITVEDPVEFVHPRGRSLIVQQEIGLDCDTFGHAVVHALRSDPDVLVIGELRDLDTISQALTAAETGHVVLATLHTTGSAGTINRIIDVFPAGQQQQVKVQLSASLNGILSQKLLPRADGSGRLMVYELLVANDAARNLIREGKAHQLGTVIQTGRAAGMVLMDQMVKDALHAGEITYDVALANVGDRRIIDRHLPPASY